MRTHTMEYSTANSKNSAEVYLLVQKNLSDTLIDTNKLGNSISYDST